MLKKVLITLMVVLMAVSVSTARELEGVTMPESLPVGSDVLGLNGLGLRNLMVIKVYVAGLYLKNPTTDPAAIISADEPMIMRLQMLRDTQPKTMNQALLNGMRTSVGAGFSQIKERTEEFKAMLYDPLVAGDVFNFIYKPGKGLEVYKGKEHRGTIAGLDFKKAFFGIWLNDINPPDPGLKAGLLAGKFSEEVIAKQKEMLAAAPPAPAPAPAVVATAPAAEEVKTAVADVKTAAADKAAKVTTEAKAATAAATATAAAAGAQASAKTAKKAAEVKEVAKQTVAEAPKALATAAEFAAEDVYFNVASTVLNKKAKRNLDQKIAYLKANAGAAVVLEPVCDTQGSREKNMMLANKRGENVRAYLVAAGIDAARIETAPVREVEAAGTYVNNRRVHLSIK